MIKHIVLFKLKNPTAEECQKAVDVLLGMRGKVPQIITIEAGVDFLRSERSYDVALAYARGKVRLGSNRLRNIKIWNFTHWI